MTDQKRDKVGHLAETIGASRAKAKQFGDEVNRLLGMRRHSSVSYAYMCDVIRSMSRPATQPLAVVEAIMLRDSHGAELYSDETGTIDVHVAAEQTHQKLPGDGTSTVVGPSLSVPKQTHSGLGTVVQVHQHHVSIDTDDGRQVNCLLTRWPTHLGPAQDGMRVECRYVPENHEVTQILRVLRHDARQDSRDEHSEQRSNVGFDEASFRERLHENHRYEIMAFLKEHGEHGHIEWYRMKDAKPPRFALPTRPLMRHVDQALRSTTGLTDLYRHQALALDAIREGKNLLLVTQTASGKTLCYNPAIFEALCASDGAGIHALYVFPLNALLMDQKAKADALRERLTHFGHPISVEVLRKGLGQERFEIAKRNPNILCCNPELLGTMLGDVRKGHWHDFFRGLRYVVVDEVHFYRGLLGIHAAGLLRRVLLAARHGNMEPQFILSFATVSDPLDLATRLTSLPASSFLLLGEENDGSAQEVKHWVVYDPGASAHRGDSYNGYLGTAAAVMVDLLSAKDSEGRPSPLNTVLFARSMRDVNRAHQMVVESLHRRCPELAGKVKKFISAYLGPEDKREIYDGLCSGKYVGVVSTNALEAGVDIGRLDACIIAGFPYTVMRMRQMAGRVGRRKEGIVVFVPHPLNPVDDYYRSTPELLLSQPPESFVVDADSPYIIRKHVNAAAYELGGISLDEARIFGNSINEIVAEAANRHIIKLRGDQLIGTWRNYNDPDDDYAIHNIRSNVQVSFAVCKDDDIECTLSDRCWDANTDRKGRCDKRISVVDEQYVYRDCHPGAVYESGENGSLYRIVSLSDTSRIVRAIEIDSDSPTRSFADETTTIEIIGAPRGSKPLQGGASIAWGKVKVTRSFDGYYTYDLIPARRCRRCRTEFDETVHYCPQCSRPTQAFFRQSKPVRHDFPPPYNERGFRLELDTIAAWIVVPARIEESLYDASPCKLLGDNNRLLLALREPFAPTKVPRSLGITPAEQDALHRYWEQAQAALGRRDHPSNDAIRFPGIYGQCLLRSLRRVAPESRSLEIFEAVTGYPVSRDLRHVCRKCQSSVLLPGLHTIEHTVAMRYPSVALGDQDDLGSQTLPIHPATGGPTIFWFDSYQGGIGAGEKVFEKIGSLLDATRTTLLHCGCSSVEGCPYCTQLARCGRGNGSLSKPAAWQLAHLLLGRTPPDNFVAFVYGTRSRQDFNNASEYVKQPHGWGEEQPAQSPPSAPDPFDLLRVQHRVHQPVLDMALVVRGDEIQLEMPPISLTQLQDAFLSINRGARPSGWNLSPEMDPYQVLEVMPNASKRMIGRVYRVIAREVHPDYNRDRREWANRMMQIVNTAYESITKNRNDPDDDGH